LPLQVAALSVLPENEITWLQQSNWSLWTQAETSHWHW